MFLKLFKRGTPPRETKTLFITPSEKSIPWEILTDSEIKLYPLIQVKRIYIGAQVISLQLELKSAVVSYIVSSGSKSKQLDTLARLRTTEALDMVDAQLAKITTERQSALVATQKQKQSEPKSETDKSETTSPASPGKQLIKPIAIPKIKREESMTDFMSKDQ